MNSADKPVVAIGTFDGVHRGHCAMLELAKKVAAPENRKVIAATFDPHPRSVVAGGAPPLLCSIDERVERICELGADDVCVVPFTTALSKQTPREFFDEWILERLNAAGIVVGHNFRFGHRAAGDISVLREFCDEAGIELAICDLLVDENMPVSSSRIRRHLLGGEVVFAEQLLGRWYEIEAVVEHGARRGRELGMPTANLAVPPTRLVPLDGVYGGWATLEGKRYKAAISVGTNPQFTADQPHPPRTVEVHLLDYSGPDFYGEMLATTFELRVRGQRTFDSVEELIACMKQDLEKIERGL